MRNRWMLLILCFFAASLWLPSCNRPIPTQRRGTATAIPTKLDALALTRTDISGKIMATLTAANATTVSAPVATTSAPGTPEAQVSSETPAETAAGVSPTAPVTGETMPPPTPSATEPPPVSPSVATVSPSPISATPSPVAPTVKPSYPTMVPILQPILAIPATYQLQKGEFPWCIARRYDLDPRQLMRVNGFYFGQIFYPGQIILFPLHPRPFPGVRALRPHPALYTVRPGDTLNKIACWFGDVDPLFIAQVNGLTPPYHLRSGQVLNIP